MADIDQGAYDKPSRQRAFEEADRASQRAAQALRQARASQLSAAESLDRSAASHEQAAKGYEDAAAQGGLRSDELRHRAARHRRFAQEDRQAAQQMRHNIEE